MYEGFLNVQRDVNHNAHPFEFAFTYTEKCFYGTVDFENGISMVVNLIFWEDGEDNGLDKEATIYNADGKKMEVISQPSSPCEDGDWEIEYGGDVYHIFIIWSADRTEKF